MQNKSEEGRGHQIKAATSTDVLEYPKKKRTIRVETVVRSPRKKEVLPIRDDSKRCPETRNEYARGEENPHRR